MIPPTSIDGTDITGATIDGTDVQEITVDGDVVFSAGPSAGLHYYLVEGSFNAEVLHYELTTPFNLANKGSPTSNLSVNNNRVDNIEISNDGTKFYAVEEDGNNVEQYTLSTPFNLNSASSPTDITTLGTTFSECFDIADNGTKLYMNDSGEIKQRTLTTPFDITTHSGVNASLSGESTNGPGDPAFKPDGTKITFGDRFSPLIVTYDLGTPFDISTASNKTTYDATADSGDSDPSCLKWNGDGTVALVRHASPDMVNRYTTTTPYSVSGMSFDQQIFNNPDFAAGGHEFNYTF